ncbi:hypothetical protein D3C86_2068900 [compost metagenome]
MTVRRIDLLHRSPRVSDTQDGTLLIGGQQLTIDGIAFARLQRQQPGALLKYGLAGLPLQVCYQMLVTVKPLQTGLPD